LAEEVNPGTYVYYIHLGPDSSADQSATFFGNLTEQIEKVCEDLASDQIVGTAPAINGLGFSQGGQFLRAYVERCNKPPVANLVTFGSQHNGIAEFQNCGSSDWLCKGAQAILRGNTWSSYVQRTLVPAQYFRKEEELEEYLEHSNFLADVNNEREVKNKTYKENLMKLEKFAMFMFSEDTTVIPKESAWFSNVNETTGEETKLQDRKIYKEDWLGLKALDEEGKLDFLVAEGGHMQLDEDLLKETFKTYFTRKGK
jgi:palmitoyl-protein thioesterase